MKFFKYWWNISDVTGARFRHDNREFGDGIYLLHALREDSLLKMKEMFEL